MRLGDLTTLGNVKAWLSTSNYVSTGIGVDPLLQQLITRQSSGIYAYLNRSWILPRDHSETFNGENHYGQYTNYWPINSVSLVSMNGQPIPPAPLIEDGRAEGQFGFRLEPWDGIPPGGPQVIGLAAGGRFCRGVMNLQIDYNAGYLVSGESHTIPSLVAPAATAVVEVDQPYGIWAQDVQVVRDSGAEMTQVFRVPQAVGEYQVLPPDEVVGTPPNTSLTPPGQYAFFAGDVGSKVQISYGYIPAALEQVSIEMILERYVYRTRIGELSRTVAQQVTARYDMSEVPAYAKPTLQTYCHVLPT